VSCRAAVLVAAGSISLVLLTGCAEIGGGGGGSEEEFIGPLSNELIARASTDCDNGEIGAGDTLTVSGAYYLPEAVITLRWTVLSAGETGTWPSVTADENGSFTADLKISGSMADEGEEISITSEGAGATGVTMQETTVEMGTC